MSSTPPLPVGPELRLLAAVVFTDVVGFTTRVQVDELGTLKLLERDFAVMRKSSKSFSGKVLKTTGDGLLVYFTSAVRAMAWVLRTQRHFAEKARTEPADEILRHRVGIHLGDVYIKADDVMGDGVNIAARLLAEAPPGGICISQTVYDVVKNKLKLNVVQLEPRKLKNIKEPIQMYHVLLDPPQRMVPATTGTRTGVTSSVPASVPAGPPSVSRHRKLAIAGLLLLAMGVVTLLIVQANYEREEGLARSQATQNALGAMLAGKAGSPGGKIPEAAALPDPETRANNPIAAEEYDFAKLTVDRPAGGPGKSGDNELILRKADECTQILFAWMDAELRRFTRDRPLEVIPLGDGPAQRRSWFTDAAGKLTVAVNGATRPRDWRTLNAEEQASLVASVLSNSAVPPSRDVVRGAEAFAYVHRLPELVRALAVPRARRAGGGLAP